MTDVDLYDYDFDPALIAQSPPAKRTDSRLLLLDRQRPDSTHHRFAELPGLLRGDELLVVNDTRVIPARLLGRKASGGRVELLLVQPVAEQPGAWRAMSRANKPLRPGQRLLFAGEEAEVLPRRDAAPATRPGGPDVKAEAGAEPGLVAVRFAAGLDVAAFLEQHGQIPLPPYIERAPRAEDGQRYQTVFARQPGAVAAPTAGLHFSPELLAEVQQRGVELARLTLHVGPGTFRPISTPDLASHRMHCELFEIPPQTAAAVARAR
ncbi:MAG: tRNA preQ1(34) S-adenosylmethionine ribosyltransferase-isomerase QueA, partial [Deltaproteobacteria bacterium]|nr:tRNA preQ1(34) S-adenosylmethionine ribosyltransferase-isomerase QueA [Deltaproteobacteria bacterium]